MRGRELHAAAELVAEPAVDGRTRGVGRRGIFHDQIGGGIEHSRIAPAEAVLGRFRLGDDAAVQAHPDADELARACAQPSLGHRLEEQIRGLLRIGEREREPFEQAVDHGAAQARILLQHAGQRDDVPAIGPHPGGGIEHPAHRHVAGEQDRQAGGADAGHGIHLLVRERALEHLGVDVDHLDLGCIEARTLGIGREERRLGRGRHRADLLAGEIGRRLDRAVGQRPDAHGGVVVDDRDRAQRQPLGDHQDERRGIDEAEIELPGGDRLRGRERAVAAADLKIDPARAEEAFLLGGVSIGAGALRQPGERVFHRPRLRQRGEREGGERTGGRGTFQQRTSIRQPSLMHVAVLPPIRATMPASSARPSR